jgi:hypothetical protein
MVVSDDRYDVTVLGIKSFSFRAQAANSQINDSCIGIVIGIEDDLL